MKNYSTPKKMKKVGDLFEKYQKHFKAPQASVEKSCVEAIYRVTGYEVSQKDVLYKVGTKTLSLKVPSVLKSELRFKYPDILKEIKRDLGKESAPEVIL